MKKVNPWSAELIVATLAVVIGVCTMFVYIYQARIMSSQMHASVWPYLQTNFVDGQQGIKLNVNNKGVGPALIKQAAIIVDNIRYEDTQHNIDSLMHKITGKHNLLNGYTNLKDRVISANEEVSFIEVNDSLSVRLLKQSLAKHIVRIEICYCSVYDDCWTVTGGKTEACKDCEH